MPSAGPQHQSKTRFLSPVYSARFLYVALVAAATILFPDDSYASQFVSE